MRTRHLPNECTLARRHDKCYTTCSAAKGKAACCVAMPQAGQSFDGCAAAAALHLLIWSAPLLAPVNLSELTR